MLQSRVVRVTFPRHVGSTNTANGFCSFPTPITSACIALNGFDVNFMNGDHHLLELKIDGSNAATIRNDRKTVDFSIAILLRDNSGNIDDPYQGWVDILVIAE
jgi:hypothetical protein